MAVDGETRVELIAWMSEEAGGEFALEGEDAEAWGMREGEEFKGQRGGDLWRLCLISEL